MSIPLEIVKVLEEFVDVIREELHNGLVLKRDIQHHIDLIPRETLLDQESYRMSPTKHIELNKQVTQLIRKGVVRESMSSCVVPGLLTPEKDVTWMISTYSRAINRITIKYQFPTPSLDDMMYVFAWDTYFSRFDLLSGYHQIWI